MFDSDYERENQEISNNLKGIKNTIMVMSGKGGVGKSTVAANLAAFLASKQYNVGLLDIDLHGPSIPKFFGISHHSIMIDGNSIIPIPFNSKLQIVSIGNMIPSEETGLIWRGPKKTSMIRGMLKDIRWKNLDYLIIDSPPGTGDEQLSITQSISNLTGAVIVTTPQDIALLDVKKSLTFCKTVGMPILGLIENMSGLNCPYCHQTINLFKSGGGEALALKDSILFLGKISIDPQTALDSDEGKLVIYSEQKNINKDEMITAFSKLIKE